MAICQLNLKEILHKFDSANLCNLHNGKLVTKNRTSVCFSMDILFTMDILYHIVNSLSTKILHKNRAIFSSSFVHFVYGNVAQK